MALASFVQTAFLGGEWSLSAQGALADPRYKVAMNVCYNAVVMTAGAWTRRPGTRFCAATRAGLYGRLIPFDFKQSAPYNIELTSGYMRFFSNGALISTNDAIAISSISTASPASVALSATMPSDWATGQSFYFSGLAGNNPLLQNRVFVGTKVDGTHITIVDAVTGDSIDGSTLGTFVSGTLNRVLEITTPWVGSDVETVRSVQTGTESILVTPTDAPQILTVQTPPTALPATNATFSLQGLTFLDGPYLDPPTNGALLTPSSQTGTPLLTLTFAAWSSTKTYSIGSLVLSSSIVYKSLTDNNLNNTPASSPSNWAVVPASIGVGPNGFIATDIGRSIRLFSEPALWVSGTSYTAGTAVTWADAQGNVAYYTCLANNTASASNGPGLSATNWGINPTAAQWTWGRITALSNSISGSLSGSLNIGNMTSGGGNAAAFDGVTTKVATACAQATAFGGPATEGLSVNLAAYVGKNYSGASAQKISVATLYPSTNTGFFTSQYDINGTITQATWTFNLRAKATSPSSGSDGTLLGSYSSSQTTSSLLGPFTFGTSPVTIVSNDTTTTWNYVWIEVLLSVENIGGQGIFMSLTAEIAQVLFSAASSSGSNAASVELLGGSLTNSTAIKTWRLGLYNGSGTDGWPACGTFHEGRLWLSGSVPNRIDGSVPNSIDRVAGTINFAPTEVDGTVTDANAISYTFDAPDVNAIFWMQPDQQGIICGTQAGEWLVQASALNNPLTPTSMQAHRVTKIGCANILPVRCEHTLAFVQKHQRKVMEYFADIFSGKFTAPDLSEKAKHLTTAGIAELAYQQELAPVIWARLNDGSLIGATYKRDTLMTSQGPTFTAWHRQALGSGRTIVSIAVGASEGGNLDALSMVTLDATTGIYHVELLSDLFEEGDSIEDAWHLDNSVAPTSYATGISLGGANGITINGLWHLNGKTVTAWCGGLDCGDWPVTNGSMSVPFAPSTNQANALFTLAFVQAFDGTMPIVVGFTYNSDGQLLRPDTQPESGARNGPGFGKVRRLHKFAALLVNTQGISFGTSFTKLHAAALRTPGGTAALAKNVAFNGALKETVNDDYQGLASQLCWRVSRPYPATVAAAGGFLETVDE